MCGGAIGDIFQSIDKAANSINPLEGTMKWATDNTVSKVYKPAGQLYDYSNSHPLESLGAMAAAYGGTSLLGSGGEGAVGAGADAAETGAAEVGASGGGEGAVSTASGFGGVGTDAGVSGVGAGAGTGVGNAAGAAADADAVAGTPTTSSGFGGVGTDTGVTSPGSAVHWLSGLGNLSGIGGNALKVLGPAVATSLLSPKPPKTKAVSLMPDPLAEQQAAQQRLLTTMATRGRASTILTSPGGSGSLGG